MWPLETSSKKSISMREIKECFGTCLPTSTWAVVFINLEVYFLPTCKAAFALDIMGYFNTREEAASIAKKAYGLRAIAPIIRGNMDDPLRRASFYLF
jgi:hypothetical protein